MRASARVKTASLNKTSNWEWGEQRTEEGPQKKPVCMISLAVKGGSELPQQAVPQWVPPHQPLSSESHGPGLSCRKWSFPLGFHLNRCAPVLPSRCLALGTRPTSISTPWASMWTRGWRSSEPSGSSSSAWVMTTQSEWPCMGQRLEIRWVGKMGGRWS